MATFHQVESERLEVSRGQDVVPAVAIAVLALLLAVLGHVVTAQRNHPGWGALLFGTALCLFFRPSLQTHVPDLDRITEIKEPPSVYQPLIRRTVWRLAFLTNGIILSAIAFWAFAGNRLDRGFWFWLLGILYLVAALLERPQTGWRQRATERFRKLGWRTPAMIVLVTAAAAFFRLYALDAIPVEMTSDHAEKLLDVYDVLNGRRAIFFPRNTGREALQFYLTAGIIRWSSLEIGHLALKVGTASFGIMTVPFTYVLGKELGGHRVGLIASFLLAISHWHVAISRVGLRFPFTAAFATPALYFLLRALRKNGRNDWLAAGVILGAGLHTYTAMRIVPFLFLLLIAVRLASDLVQRLVRDNHPQEAIEPEISLTWHFWRNAVAGAGVSLAIFLPLFRYMLEFPESFWYRAFSRAQNEPMALSAMWRTFWLNTKNALLMFNYRGDVVPMNTIPEVAVLGPITGGLFVLGLFWILWQVLRHRQRRTAYLAISFFVMLLPSILSLAYPGENPSVVRAGGAVPIVTIIAAIPLVGILETIKSDAPKFNRQMAILFMFVVLGAATAYNYDWYFNRYDENVRRSLWNATELGATLKAFEERGGSLQNAYHVAFPHWVDTRNIAINAGDITWRNVVTDLSQIAVQAQQPGPKLYLVFPSHGAALKVLSEVYSQGQATLVMSDRPGKSFYIYEVPATEKTSGAANRRQGAVRGAHLRALPAIFHLLR